MRIIWRSFGVYVITYLIIVFPIDVSSIDNSNIGVEEGDTFSYEVEKYKALEGFNQGYYLGYDYTGHTGIYVTKGDKFTITIGNQLVREESLSDIDSIGYRVNYKEVITDGLAYFNHDYGRIITSIDWEYQKQNQHESVWKINALEEGFFIDARFVLNEWELIDTPDEFGMKINYLSDPTLNGNAINAEIKYQKTTGMLSFESVDIKFEGDVPIETEYKIKLFSTDTQQLILPGFQWNILLVIFSLVTIRKQREKNQR